MSKMEQVRKEENRKVKRNIEYYNLDMIISIGFRVNSKNSNSLESIKSSNILSGESWDWPQNIKKRNYTAAATRYILIEDIGKVPGCVVLHFQISGKAEVRTDEEMNQAVVDYVNKYLKNGIEKINSDFKITRTSIIPLLIEGQNVIVDSDASDNKDELGNKISTSQKLSIPSLIVIGLAVIIGGAIGIDLTLSSNNETKSNSSYKMYFDKDFGNKITYGQEVEIRTRIVEVTSEGNVINRTDLNKNIKFRNKKSFNINKTYINKNVMCALISIDKNSKNENEGIVSIAYEGEGGSFINNVSFDLVGKLYIDFGKNGNVLTMYYDEEKEYTKKIKLIDFIDEPKMELKYDEKLFEVKLTKIDNSNYEISVLNLSKKKDVETHYIELNAISETEKVKEDLRICLCKKGLMIDYDSAYKKANCKDEVLQLKSYELKEENIKLEKTRIDLLFSALIDGEEKIITPLKFNENGIKIKVDKIEGENETTKKLLEKYEYKFDEKDYKDGIITYIPLKSLPELKEPYYAFVHISAIYKEEEYKSIIKVRLVGEGKTAKQKKKIEYEKAKERIKKFLPEEKWENYNHRLEMINKCFGAEDLRLFSVTILKDSQAYYLNEAQIYLDKANTNDSLAYWLEWTQLVGDIAFGYLTSLYGGPIIDALAGPVKKIVVKVYNEPEFNPEIIANAISEVLDALAREALDIENLAKLDKNKIAHLMAGFLMFSVSKNYTLNVDKEGNRSFYNAIMTTFSNLTVDSLKEIVKAYLKKGFKITRIVY